MTTTRTTTRTRSSLLEGLEEISEEEQLMLLLEISKQEAGPQADSGADTQANNLSEAEEDEEYKKAIEDSIIQSLSLSERNNPGGSENHIARRIPECPVCFERFTGQSQVFQCQQGHFVCGTCRPRTHICPTCRGTMIGRCNGFEQFLQSLNN